MSGHYSIYCAEHPLDGPGPPRGRATLEPGGHLDLLPAAQHDPAVDPGRLAASVDLRHPSHAQQSVRPGQSISFCRLRTFFRSPALLAVKIRCRSRRTSPSTCRQSTASQSRTSSSGPFTMMVSNLPLSSSVSDHLLSTGSPDPRQLPFGPGIRPYPTSYAQTTRRRVPVLRPAVSCCLSAIGIGFLGHPAPAGELNLPHGRPTGLGLLCPQVQCQYRDGAMTRTPLPRTGQPHTSRPRSPCRRGPA